MQEQSSHKEKLHIEVTRQTPDDVEGTTDVYFQSWLATYPNLESGVTREHVEYEFADAYSADNIKKKRRYAEHLGEDNVFLVAKVNGVVVGLCTASRASEVNRVQTIYVLPDYYRKGVGTKLWEEARKFHHKHKETIVEVVDYNKNAINFYTAQGFIDTGKRLQNKKLFGKSGVTLTEIEMRRPAEINS
jgi:GNAT superfamily N-acetyltransferase